MKRTEGLEALIQTLQTEKFYHFLKEMLPIKGPQGRGATPRGQRARDEKASSLQCSAPLGSWGLPSLCENSGILPGVYQSGSKPGGP